MEYINFSQAQEISRMWNFLNLSRVEGMVSDNIVYESYLVLNPIEGKEDFVQNMQRKLQTVFNAVQAGEVQLYAQLVSIEGIYHECFVKLNQIVNGQPDESLISVSVNEDGTIYRLMLNPMHPNLNTSEVYPDED